MRQKFTPITRTLSATVLAIVVLLLSIAPIAAQEVPVDQLTTAFRAVREALEERFNTDLTYVTRYTFDETEFLGGIDSCLTLDDPNAARPLYYGWRFVVTGLDGRQFEGRSSFDASIITACPTVTVTTAAATAVPGANPNLPAPVAGSGATGSFELGGHVLEFNANTVSLVRRSGMVWVKKQLRYAQGQDPATAAGMINAAKSNGFKILLGIVGNPSELGAGGDAYIQGYANFVGGVAALGADAIEVWNEPNIDREWPAGQINGANYTRLLAASFNAIKSRNGGTIVISGAPAPTGFFGAAGCTAQGCNDDVFMQQMAAAGATQYMDCVGLHYNLSLIHI